MTISAYSAILLCATRVVHSKIQGYYPIRKKKQLTYRDITASRSRKISRMIGWMDGWMMAREEDDGGRRERVKARLDDASRLFGRVSQIGPDF